MEGELVSTVHPTQHLPAGQSPGPFVLALGRGQNATPQTKVETLLAGVREHELTVLVETGIWQGGGSGMGVVDAGAVREDHYFVVDWQESNCELVRERYPRARVFCGDSAAVLPGIVAGLERVGVPALFWLDAHGIEIDVGFPPCPLYAELRAIHSSSLPHVVLIDDMHMMGGHDWPALDELRSFVDASGRWARTEEHDIMYLTPVSS
jgi:hypothetical protein